MELQEKKQVHGADGCGVVTDSGVVCGMVTDDGDGCGVVIDFLLIV